MCEQGKVRAFLEREIAAAEPQRLWLSKALRCVTGFAESGVMLYSPPARCSRLGTPMSLEIGTSSLPPSFS